MSSPISAYASQMPAFDQRITGPIFALSRSYAFRNQDDKVFLSEISRNVTSTALPIIQYRVFLEVLAACERGEISDRFALLIALDLDTIPTVESDLSNDLSLPSLRAQAAWVILNTRHKGIKDIVARIFFNADSLFLDEVDEYDLLSGEELHFSPKLWAALKRHVEINEMRELDALVEFTRNFPLIPTDEELCDKISTIIMIFSGIPAHLPFTVELDAITHILTRRL